MEGKPRSVHGLLEAENAVRQRLVRHVAVRAVCAAGQFRTGTCSAETNGYLCNACRDSCSDKVDHHLQGPRHPRRPFIFQLGIGAPPSWGGVVSLLHTLTKARKPPQNR